MIDYDILPPVPTDQVLLALEETLRLFDWAAFGLGSVTIRQARNQYAAPDSVPCVTIRWVSDEPRQSDQENRYYTADEMGVEMTVVLEIEVELEPDDGDLLAKDPTGTRLPLAIAALCQRALRAEDARISDYADGVSDRGRAQNDDSTADNARFEQTVIVLYRVRTDDPSVLLARGVNA